MSDQDPNELITMKLPDSDATSTTSREAFEQVWKAKGFVLVEGTQPTTAAQEEE
jgi:hypothetical protein